MSKPDSTPAPIAYVIQLLKKELETRGESVGRRGSNGESLANEAEKFEKVLRLLNNLHAQCES